MKAQKLLILPFACAWALVAWPRVAPAAQNQSLAQQAQKVREQEKTSPKATKVWTNENLPTSAPLSVVGQPAPQPSANPQTAAQEAPKSAAKPESAAELHSQLADLQSKLKDARADLHSAQVDLNIAQREYKLDSNQFYSSPDYNSNRQGKAKLDADQSRISDKQSSADAAQQKVDELEKRITAVQDKLKAQRSQSAAPAPKS